MNIVEIISRRHMGWKKPSTNIKDVELSHRNKCKCGKAGDFFHYFGAKLYDAKSVEEFKAQTIALIQHIWLASYARKMSPCIITAVRECIETYKQTKLPVGEPVVQFYNFRLEGQSLPAWIILHSPSDDPSQVQVGIRYCLLQTFLVEFALTGAIRDELYFVCARMGFNNFFSQIRRETVRELPRPPRPIKTHAEYIEIGRDLRPSSGLAETLKVVHTRSGFKMKWFIPNMSQRLGSGHVGKEFVARGQVWGVYILAQGRQLGHWELFLHPLKPSRVNLVGKEVSVSFSVSRHCEKKIFSRGSTTELLSSKRMSTVDFPEEGMSNDHYWPFSNNKVDGFHRCINEDGSCWLIITLQAPESFKW